MKNFSFTDYNSRTKFFWLALAFLAILSLGVASYELFSRDSFYLLSFAISCVIVFFLSKIQLKIPNTNFPFSFRESSVFFGTIWFGIPGAVFTVLISTLTSWKFLRTDQKGKFFILSSNIFSALLASQLFYLTLKISSNFVEPFVGENTIEKSYLFLSAIVLGFASYFVNGFLHSSFFSLVFGKPVLSVWNESVKYQFISYIGGLLFSVLIYFLLTDYGIKFGLIFLPASIIAYFTYYFQAQTLSQKTKEITNASRIHLATVEALATAIDARDQTGEGHVRRVQIMAVAMGKILGLSDSDIQALRTGALLHDIGKLAIPDHILNKTGKLTSAEMEKMKIHPSVGASILERIDFDYPVISAVRYHHENWDGTGYPSKLKGENIPVTARILSIVDAYDAIRGERAYSTTVSKDEARKILMNASGTKFDPKLIDVFMRNLHNLEAELSDNHLAYSIESDENNISIQPEVATGRLKQGYVEQIKNANKEVFTLYELARVFSASLNLAETLELFTKKLGELIPFDTCAVYMLEEGSNYAIAKHVEGDNASIIKGKRVQFNNGATGYVLQNRTSVFQVNPALDFAFYETEIVSYYRSMASLPLVAENRFIGAVSLYSSELENYEEEHMRLLETVSKIASDAFSKAISHAETENRSLTDPMTGLPNARSLQTQFEIEAARAYRSKDEFQVFMIDLDGFKNVNDTFGHKTGDAVLREVSKVMRSQLRDYDFLARYAGDEFVAILPNTSNSEIQELIQRIETAVRMFALPVGNDKFAKVGASIGAASYPLNGETLDQVLIAADSAMYSVKAKRKRRNETAEKRVEAFSNKHDLQIMELDESHIILNTLH